MIESIIRRYKLFIPDEDFDQNFNDTISYLLTKINNFKPVITGYDILEDVDRGEYLINALDTYLSAARQEVYYAKYVECLKACVDSVIKCLMRNYHRKYNEEEYKLVTAELVLSKTVSDKTANKRLENRACE